MSRQINLTSREQYLEFSYPLTRDETRRTFMGRNTQVTVYYRRTDEVLTFSYHTRKTLHERIKSNWNNFKVTCKSRFDTAKKALGHASKEAGSFLRYCNRINPLIIGHRCLDRVCREGHLFLDRF